MSSATDEIPFQRQAITVWMMRLLAVVALGIACYLAWSTLVVGTVAGCGDGAVFDCGHVLQSKYSKIFGWPVSIPAAGTYVLLLASLAFVHGRSQTARKWGWRLSALVIGAALCAAIWFTYVQVFQLHKLCWYCLAVHSCGVLLAVALVFLRPLPYNELRRLALPGLAAACTLALIQHVSPEPRTYELVTEMPVEETSVAVTEQSMVFDMDFVDEEAATLTDQVLPEEPLIEPVDNSPFTGSKTFEAPAATLTPIPQEGATAAGRPAKRYVDFRFAKVKLNTYDWPILGSPEAPHVLMELFDYTCPHCRKMNVHLSQAKQRYGDQLAILLLPVPLNRECNPYYTKVDPRHADACELARLALAVWQLDDAKFATFHQWLFMTEPAPNAVQARQYAETIVDPQQLREQLKGARLSRYISAHANILKQAGGTPLPRVESEEFSLKGKTNAAADLFRTLEDRLGMRP